MDRFFVFVGACVIAYLLMRFRKPLHDFTGDIGFAEQYLGSGGTYTFFVLLGVLVFIIGLMYAFGTLQVFLGNTVGRIF